MDELRHSGFSIKTKLSVKTTIENTITSFVNDSTQKTVESLMIDEFAHYRSTTLILLLKAENNHLDILLSVVIEILDTEEQCKCVLDQLENILQNAPEVLGVFWSGVSELLDKIPEISPDVMILKRVQALGKFLLDISNRRCAFPSNISLELLHRTRCWRRYSLNDLKLLNCNPNVGCWYLAEIAIDWLNIHKNSTNHKENLKHLREMIGRRLDSMIEENQYISLSEYTDLVLTEFDYLFSRSHKTDDPMQQLFGVGSFISKTFSLSSNWLLPVIALLLIMEPFSLAYDFLDDDFDKALVMSCALSNLLFFIIIAIAWFCFKDINLIREGKKVQIILSKKDVDDFVESSITPVKVNPFSRPPLSYFHITMLIYDY